MIPPKKHRKSKANHEALEQHLADFFGVEDRKNNKPACIACHGSRQCARCQGEGCDDCDYVGICPNCLDIVK